MFKKHRFNIFPEMNPDDYARLKNDIEINGYDTRHPVYLYERQILDGWNRSKVCQELGLTPNYTTFEGSDADAINYVMRTNKRRNLSSAQWACIAVESEEFIQIIKEATEKERREKQSQNASNQYAEPCNNNLLQPKRDPNQDAVATKVAEVFNTNRTYVNEAAKMKDEDPALFEELKTGKKSFKEVKRERQKNKRKEISIALSEQSLPENKSYRVVYADPPWSYGNDFTKAMPGSTRPEDHYMTMSIEQICKMPVKDILQPNAVLFLWATSPLLPEAFEVIKAWGFIYKTSFIWDKVKHNMGHYNSVRHELLLVATKGSCTPDITKQYDSVVSIERTAHSKKPEFFINMIDELYTYGDRIELFCREPKQGWDVMGNQLQEAI